jgi:serine protease Do
MEGRAWRHPSELGLRANEGPRVVLRSRPAPSRLLVAAAVGLLLGTGLAVAGVAASGNLGGGDSPTVVERLAAPPVRQTPATELAVAETALPALVRVRATGPAGTRTATAAIVRDDGVMVTTSDVLDGAETIEVVLDDGTVETASLLGRHRPTDLGVIGIEAAGLPVVALPDAQVAEAVAFGDPVVLVDSSPSPDAPTLTPGIVSVPSTAIPSAALASTVGPNGPMFGMLQVHLPARTEVPNGGILLDVNGSLVGVVTARAIAEDSEADDADGPRDIVVYATPFDHARRVYAEVAQSGRFSAADLPVQVATVDPDEARNLDLPSSGGALVTAAPTDPIAVDAGFAAGDVITEINGTPVLDVNDARTELRRYPPGEEVAVVVVREGAAVTRNVRLGTEPGAP